MSAMLSAHYGGIPLCRKPCAARANSSSMAPQCTTSMPWIAWYRPLTPTGQDILRSRVKTTGIIVWCWWSAKRAEEVDSFFQECYGACIPSQLERVLYEDESVVCFLPFFLFLSLLKPCWLEPYARGSDSICNSRWFVNTLIVRPSLSFYSFAYWNPPLRSCTWTRSISLPRNSCVHPLRITSLTIREDPITTSHFATTSSIGSLASTRGPQPSKYMRITRVVFRTVALSAIRDILLQLHLRECELL